MGLFMPGIQYTIIHSFQPLTSEHLCVHVLSYAHAQNASKCNQLHACHVSQQTSTWASLPWAPEDWQRRDGESQSHQPHGRPEEEKRHHRHLSIHHRLWSPDCHVQEHGSRSAPSFCSWCLLVLWAKWCSRTERCVGCMCEHASCTMLYYVVMLNHVLQAFDTDIHHGSVYAAPESQPRVARPSRLWCATHTHIHLRSLRLACGD